MNGQEPSATRSELARSSRLGLVLGHTGTVVILSGCVVAAPAVLALFVRSERGAAAAFLVPGAALVLIGVVLRRAFRGVTGRTLTPTDAALIILFSWVFSVAAGAVPFVLVQGLDLTEAVFESTSGWTTTGLSVMDPDSARPSILLLRSALQLAGGAGLAILMLSALLGPPGTGLSSAEGRSEQLVPLVSRSAALVVRIYAAYAVAGIVLYRVAGMGWFDAVNHAFTAVSTGGFSTRGASIGYWNSPAVEAVSLLLMVAGSLSFVTAYRTLKGDWRALPASGEVRLFAALAIVGTVLLLGTVPGSPEGLLHDVRVAVFEGVSALTTTGFSTVGYGNWPALGWWTLIVLMLVGGGAGSTAGGLKQHRVYLLIHYAAFDVRRRLGPARAAYEFSLGHGGGRRFPAAAEVVSIGAFVFLYGAALALGTGVLAACGYGLKESLFEYASALGTVGLSVGVTSADAPGLVLWAEALGMLLGRLEFYAVFVGAASLAKATRAILAG